MLLAKAFMRLLHLWDNVQMKSLSENLIKNRVPVVLIQIIVRTLLSQGSNGAWEQMAEVTAYSILTLVAVSSLPFVESIKTVIASAIKSGRQFLDQADLRKGQYIWVEKVTYGSAVLSQAYSLAAMNACESSYVWSAATGYLVNTPPKLARFTKFFSKLPTFPKEPEWRVTASILEGYAFLPQLKRVKLDIFQSQITGKDEYLEYIPCTWTISNNCGSDGIFLETNSLWHMMVISMLDFLVDEYMESVVAQLDENELESLGRTIRWLCDKPKAHTDGTRKRRYSEYGLGVPSEDLATSTKDHRAGENRIEIRAVLSSYIKYILDHPRIAHASPSDQLVLRSELQKFLLAHLTQIQDNARFFRQEFPSVALTTPFLAPPTAYYTWAHTTAAQHISCPFSFAFYTSLLGASSANGRDCFGSARHKYLAHDLCSHLAVMSRLYNDYASIPRDRAEKNLNSINFPEFHPQGPYIADSDDETECREGHLKKELLGLATYERQCVGMTRDLLVEELRTGSVQEKRVAAAMTLFVSVTELYADMYVAKDLTNWVK